MMGITVSTLGGCDVTMKIDQPSKTIGHWSELIITCQLRLVETMDTDNETVDNNYA